MLVEGADFYAAPRVSPDGGHVAWLEWAHPNLPWDGTQLYVAPMGADGRLGERSLVAGSPSDWVSQPRWSPDGVLHFIAEPTGWMHLHRWRDGRAERITDGEVEFGYPDWQFGFAHYGFLDDGSLLAVGSRGGRDRLFRVAPGGDLTELELPYTELTGVAVDGGRVVFRGAGPTSAPAIIELDVATGGRRDLRRSSDRAYDPASISAPRARRVPDDRRPRRLRAVLRAAQPAVPWARRSTSAAHRHQPWRSHRPGVDGPESRRSSCSPAAGSRSSTSTTAGAPATAASTASGSRGRGASPMSTTASPGPASSPSAATIDPASVCVRGGSASGYTTLSALAFRDDFAAGISYFGLGDLLAFARETHKFESRYLDRLIGPLPEAEATYRERSPSLHTERMSAPVLVLQGAEDRIVPVSEAERIVDALFERGIPHAYVLFPGEDHGFRGAASIIRAFQAELSFLGEVFGFTPADELPPLELVRPPAPPARPREPSPAAS